MEGEVDWDVGLLSLLWDVTLLVVDDKRRMHRRHTASARRKSRSMFPVEMNSSARLFSTWRCASPTTVSKKFRGLSRFLGYTASTVPNNQTLDSQDDSKRTHRRTVSWTTSTYWA